MKSLIVMVVCMWGIVAVGLWESHGKNLKEMTGWIGPAVAAGGMAISAAIARGKDKRQLNQQGKLNSQQIEANEKMLEIQNNAAYDIWQRTGPQGQMKEYEKAGLNAGLMYGMGSAGGQSIGTGSASVGAAKAPSGSGRETEDSIGMAMQIGLMKAQIDNINADTAQKKSSVPVNETQSELNIANRGGKDIENTVAAYLTYNKPEGGEAKDSGESIAVRERVAKLNKDEADVVFRLDENKRQELMNSAELKSIAVDIENGVKEGKKLEEVINNLKKEGKLLDIEIKFADWGFDKGDVGKFVTGLGQQILQKYLGGGRGGKK